MQLATFAGQSRIENFPYLIWLGIWSQIVEGWKFLPWLIIEEYTAKVDFGGGLRIFGRKYGLFVQNSDGASTPIEIIFCVVAGSDP